MSKPPYRKNLFTEVPEKRVRPQNNPKEVAVRMVEGVEMSFMYATRESGYHSGPHYHDAEQINYIVEGEFWFFVEDQGYRCVKGDVMRIPRNKLHWAWNRGDVPCVLIEAHSPPLTGDQKLRDAAIPLTGPEEDTANIPRARNIHITDPRTKDVEEKAINEEAERNRGF